MRTSLHKIDTLLLDQLEIYVIVFISLVLVFFSSLLYGLEHFSMTEMDSVPLVIMTLVDTQYVSK